MKKAMAPLFSSLIAVHQVKKVQRLVIDQPMQRSNTWHKYSAKQRQQEKT